MANKTRGQLVSKLLHMKQGNNANSVTHLSHNDIDDICEYLLDDKHEVEKLEKGIDKLCKVLAQTYPFGVNKYNTNCHAESWKEWCLEDDWQSN